MKIRLLLLGFIIMALATLGLSNANAESDKSASGHDKALCTLASPNTEQCYTFVLGFLQGAVLTDSAIVKSFENTSESGFKERALRTRLTQRNQPATLRAGFCLPDNIKLEIIAENISAKLRSSAAESPDIALQMYALLKNDYQCPRG